MSPGGGGGGGRKGRQNIPGADDFKVANQSEGVQSFAGVRACVCVFPLGVSCGDFPETGKLGRQG